METGGTFECVDPDGTEWLVTSSLSQPEPGPLALTGEPYTSLGGEVSFTIRAGDEPFAPGDRFVFTTTGLTAASEPVTIIDGQVGTPTTAGDWDEDGDVDIDDYFVLALCLELSGPAEEPLFDECAEVFDFDADLDVDLRDTAVFEQLFTGPN